MGFGLNELQVLWTTVREIARENNKPVEEAVMKFLSDVERQYNTKLGFESKVESLRNEVNKLNQEQATLRTELLSLPLVGPKLEFRIGGGGEAEAWGQERAFVSDLIKRGDREGSGSNRKNIHWDREGDHCLLDGDEFD
jgi:hypothetical protein